MKRFLITLLKISISVGILAYLVIDAKHNGAFEALSERPKNWGMLLGATLLCSLAVLITMIRWHYLIRALDLPIHLRDSLRIGFLGYLYNLSPIGLLGGDLLKAVMLARNYPGRRTEAAATVFFDRVIGLYVLFVVASGAILLTRFWEHASPTVQGVCRATLILTAVGTAGMIVLLIPNLSNGKLSAVLSKLPYVGGIAQRLLMTVRMYRWSPGVLIASFLMSVAVHSLFAAGVYLIATGIYHDVLSLETHFVVVPLSSATGVLPISVGPFEYVLDRLYTLLPLPGGGFMLPGQGLVVALAYRIVTLLTATVGIVYYFADRRELAEVMHTAEAEQGVSP